MWCMMGKRQGAEAGGVETNCRMPGSGLGSFPGLRTQIIRRARQVRGGNGIVKPGCGSPQAWLLLLVGRTRTDAATLTMAAGRWFCHNWKFLLLD